MLLSVFSCEDDGLSWASLISARDNAGSLAISNPLFLKLKHFALAKKKNNENYIRFKQVAE